jgi:hypothetical protein
VREANAIERGLAGLGCKSPLFDLRLDHLGDVRHGRLGGFGLLVEGQDAPPVLPPA